MPKPVLRQEAGDRDDSGRFRRGSSGNPGGRPRADASVSELARERTEDALSVLTAVMKDADAPHAARVRAAEALLDRGHGKPRQAVDADIAQTFDVEGARERLYAKLVVQPVAPKQAQANNGEGEEKWQSIKDLEA